MLQLWSPLTTVYRSLDLNNLFKIIMMTGQLSYIFGCFVTKFWLAYLNKTMYGMLADICNVKRANAEVKFFSYYSLMNMYQFSGYLRICLKWQSLEWLQLLGKDSDSVCQQMWSIADYVINKWQCFTKSEVVPFLSYVVTPFYNLIIICIKRFWQGLKVPQVDSRI